MYTLHVHVCDFHYSLSAASWYSTIRFGFVISDCSSIVIGYGHLFGLDLFQPISRDAYHVSKDWIRTVCSFDIFFTSKYCERLFSEFRRICSTHNMYEPYIQYCCSHESRTQCYHSARRILIVRLCIQLSYRKYKFRTLTECDLFSMNKHVRVSSMFSTENRTHHNSNYHYSDAFAVSIFHSKCFRSFKIRAVG